MKRRKGLKTESYLFFALSDAFIINKTAYSSSSHRAYRAGRFMAATGRPITAGTAAANL
jgi:hypothetical protein